MCVSPLQLAEAGVTAPDRSTRDRATLADILRAGHLVHQFVEGFDLDLFLTDEKTQAAVLHEIIVIGEAVKRLSDTLCDTHPTIPWRLIAGMRDRLVHNYDTVDLEEVWNTATADIPALLRDLGTL